MNQIQTREQDARALVGSKMSQISTIVGNDKAKASVFASAIVNMANDGSLRNCNVESIVNTAMQIVQIGLHPNKLFGQAYVVPYKGVAQLQIGYKGLISLGYRNGWKFRAVSVYACDEFKQEFNLKGVLVYAVDKQGAEFSEFVSKKKLEQLRTTSPNQNKEELSGTWANWAEEMYKAKAIKHVASRLPINDSLAEALSLEDEPIRAEQSKPQTPKSQNLNDILNGSSVDQKVIKNSAISANSSVSNATANAQDEALLIEVAPLEREIDANADIMPLDALQNELIKRGASEAEAERLVERLSPNDAISYLADPNSIDNLLENLRS